MRGDPVGDLVAEMTRIVGTSTEPTIVSTLLGATAIEAFESGRLVEARETYHRLGVVAEYLPSVLAGAARAALWMGDTAAATDDLAALDGSGIHGPAIAAQRRTILAGLAALDGRPAEALPLYREALRAWRDLGLAWDEALCGIDMATLLDPSEPEVRAATDSAREILVRLGAVPSIARLDAALARSTIADPPSAARTETAAETPA
jgi:tetratricopeptide (TPR) repeat protein